MLLMRMHAYYSSQQHDSNQVYEINTPAVSMTAPLAVIMTAPLAVIMTAPLAVIMMSS